MPACPAWLDADARAAWEELRPDLERLGTVTAADSVALAMLADALAQYRAACAEIASGGLVVDAERGPVRNPAVGIRDAAWVRVMKGCREFGMTPVSRSSAPQAAVADDCDRFFEG
jgi:P27 family predicted phage terminase small subunit